MNKCTECGHEGVSIHEPCPGCGVDFRQHPDLLAQREAQASSAANSSRELARKRREAFGVDSPRWMILGSAVVVTGAVLVFAFGAGGGDEEARETSGIPAEAIEIAGEEAEVAPVPVQDAPASPGRQAGSAHLIFHPDSVTSLDRTELAWADKVIQGQAPRALERLQNEVLGGPSANITTLSVRTVSVASGRVWGAGNVEEVIIYAVEGTSRADSWMGVVVASGTDVIWHALISGYPAAIYTAPGIAGGGRDAVLIREAYVGQGTSEGWVTIIDVRPEGPEFLGRFDVSFDDCGARPEGCVRWSRSVWVDEAGRLAVGDERSGSIEPAEIYAESSSRQYLMVRPD